MPKPRAPQRMPITFLQTFAAQSLRAAKRLGCDQCEDDLSHVEHIGLTAGTCFEEAVRRQLGLEGPIDVDQYADLILSIKDQIGGSDMGHQPPGGAPEAAPARHRPARVPAAAGREHGCVTMTRATSGDLRRSPERLTRPLPTQPARCCTPRRR